MPRGVIAVRRVVDRRLYARSQVVDCSARNPSSILRYSGVRKSCGIAALILLLGSQGLQTAVADGETRTLSLHHMHTDENITITYKRDGRYDEAALKKLNWFLRDWRREEQTNMDPRLFDLIWEVTREVGAQKPVEVVCGYRSPETNAMLRRRSGGVARFSQHMLGRAMDFYVPGVPLEDVRVIGLRLQRGGVGYYPTSGSPFVHLDTGNVRHWPRMTREQLARVFPDGRTVHVPSDGRPMSGYALALADIEKRGTNPSAMSLASARDAGIEIGAKPQRNLLASLFSPRQEKDEDEDNDNSSAASPDRGGSANTSPARVASVDTRRPAAVSTTPAKARPAATQAAAYQLAAAKTTPAESSASIGPWSALANYDPLASHDPDGGATDTTALAYAAPVDGTQSTKTPAARAAPMGTGPARATAAMTTGSLTTGSLTNGSTTFLQKSVALPPPRKAVQPPVAQDQASAQPTISGYQFGTSPDDPWLRALVVAPNLKSYMTVTSFETPDFRELHAMMEKPASTLKMAFSSDPNAGLASDHFSGSAVVFLSTVNFLTRTASLQQSSLR
jgi:uncharacterized protein YcbK (DUF882 family)